MSLVALLRRALTARLALPVIGLTALAVVALNEWTHQRTNDFRLARAALFETRLASMEMQQLLTDAETAQRGYLITGREEYLEPYRSAMAALPAKREAALQALRSQGGDVAGGADEVHKLLEAKLSELETTITLRRAGRSDQAIELVMSNLGNETMARLRRAIGTTLELASRDDERMSRTVERELDLRRWAIHALALSVALAVAAYARKLSAEVGEREAERVRLEADVQARTADLRELAAHLQTVQETERARLSRELHDEIGGLLTAAKLDLTRLRTLRDPGLLPERVKQLSQRLDEIVAIKRRIIEGLRPSSLEHLGLRAALELLCQDVGERLGVAVDTRIDDATLGEDAQITVYRIVQEALTNVQKYAGASNVQVRLRAEAGQVQVLIADDGAGFDVSASRVNRHGLAGMRYRVESLGGRFVLDAQPGRGTRVSAWLPLAATVPPAPTAPTAPRVA